MKTKIIFSTFLLFSAMHLLWGQVPHTMNYQGILTDNSGTIVTDGSYNLTFKLYDVQSSGNALWTETQSVNVSSGIFNVILGSTNSLNLPFDKPYYVGVTVGTGIELTPRIQLTSVSYSLTADKVKGTTNIFPSEAAMAESFRK